MTFLSAELVLNGLRGDEGAHQSVRSMATYMAPSAKMTWNQEYYMIWHKQRPNINGNETDIIPGSRTFVVTGFTHVVVIVIVLVVLVQG
jgi:hypothetical protein